MLFIPVFSADFCFMWSNQLIWTVFVSMWCMLLDKDVVMFNESSKVQRKVRMILVWIVIYILLSGTCPSALTMHTEELMSWEKTHKTVLSDSHTSNLTTYISYSLHFSLTLVSYSSCSGNGSLEMSDCHIDKIIICLKKEALLKDSEVSLTND